MEPIIINKQDVLKSIYFIIAKTKNHHGNSMQGALSSKGDWIGGIFDRWINTIPESIVFNKIILPKIKSDDKFECIQDFYLYDPKLAGIATDLIGIKSNSKIIPFMIFDEKWTPIKGMPQIEVKTFKKNQNMVTLRNQNYDNEYLVMAESNFRIDYLLPFFSNDIFKNEVYEELSMNNDIFIKSDNDRKINTISKIDNVNDTLGTVTLIKITTAKAFMNTANLCGGYMSVKYIKNIEKINGKVRNPVINKPLNNYCEKISNSVYRFNSNWYDGVEDDKPYYNRRSGNKYFCKTLDVIIENIETITLVKKSNSTLYIKSTNKAKFNGIAMDENSTYKVTFDDIDRSSNKGEEYFMNRYTVNYVADCEEQLINHLNDVIK